MGHNLPLFTAHAPSFEPRGEVMFVRWPSGLAIVMPISVCKEAVGKCNEALDRWHEQHDSGVVRFPALPH